MNKTKMKNGISVLTKINKKTPRCAIVLYVKPSGSEKVPGLNYLITRLLLQGTTTYNQEQLASILDENATDIIVEKKSDYIRIKLLCLNEDIEKAIELMSDIIFNSTFEDYKKETIKIRGEFEADLDSPRLRAQDEYYRTIFKNHPYGAGRKEILEKLEAVTKEDILNEYNSIKYEYSKNISYAGDYDEEYILPLLEKYFGALSVKEIENEVKPVENLSEDRVSVIEKSDANQAQIFQGRIFPSVYSEYYPEFVLLNTLLGASGLSSRLFLELREKQGLAYTVRSVFEAFIQGGDFYVYIATEPSNIKKSVEGFKTELDKVINIPVSDEELENAKNNAIGKRRFYKETNLSEASLNGYYECIGLGYEFEEQLINKIRKITKERLQKAASEFLSTPSALTVLAPEKYLKEAGLL